MSCKGIHTRFAIPGRTHAKNYDYRRGRLYCNGCKVVYEPNEFHWCPCCRKLLRTRPRIHRRSMWKTRKVKRI